MCKSRYYYVYLWVLREDKESRCFTNFHCFNGNFQSVHLETRVETKLKCLFLMLGVVKNVCSFSILVAHINNSAPRWWNAIFRRILWLYKGTTLDLNVTLHLTPLAIVWENGDGICRLNEHLHNLPIIRYSLWHTLSHQYLFHYIFCVWIGHLIPSQLKCVKERPNEVP